MFITNIVQSRIRFLILINTFILSHTLPGYSYFGFSIVALPKSVIFGYFTFFFSNSSCAQSIILSKLFNRGLVDSLCSIFNIAAFNSLAIYSLTKKRNISDIGIINYESKYYYYFLRTVININSYRELFLQSIKKKKCKINITNDIKQLSPFACGSDEVNHCRDFCGVHRKLTKPKYAPIHTR